MIGRYPQAVGLSIGGSQVSSLNPLPISQPSNLSTFSQYQELGITRAIISATVNGDNELVAAQTGSIWVVQLFLTNDTDGTIRFESGTSGNFLTGIMPIYANATALITGNNGILDWSQFNPAGYLRTIAGEGLNMILGANNAHGWLDWIEVT